MLKLAAARRPPLIAVVTCLSLGVVAPLAAERGAAVADVPPAPVSVLGPHGSVARHGTPWWLNYANWLSLATGGQVPENCASTTVNGRRVSVIGHLAQKPGRVHVTCREPAGRPAVFEQPAVDCTTLPHDHGTFGTTPADLRRCARQMFDRANLMVTTVLDGTTVDLGSHHAVSPVQTATVPKKNAFGVAGGTRVPVASDGYVLLVASLPPGRHTLTTALRLHGRLYAATFVLHVS